VVNYAQGQSQTLSSQILSEVVDVKGVALQYASERAGLGLLVKRICFSQYPRSSTNMFSSEFRFYSSFLSLPNAYFWEGRRRLYRLLGAPRKLMEPSSGL
jgi:hypothetical protein